ncbi:MAG: hypothetical protein GY932_08040 [Arcobacter sp.]|nr:hypothetical protein [Arcobacter sp.]
MEIINQSLLLTQNTIFGLHQYSLKLDALTGKRLKGTLWSQGHFNRGTICDFDADGDLEIIIGGINNALKSAFALSIDINKLYGQTPNYNNNLLNDMLIGKFNKYLLLSKSDICTYYCKASDGIGQNE